MSTSRSITSQFNDLPHLLFKRRLLVGITALLICAATWAVDLTEFTYQCPFCRVQRTVIGLLGLALILPNPRHWSVRFVASILAVFGLNVGATQHFRGWVRIMAGEFKWGEQWYMNSWMLSGFALAIIVALILLIWSPDCAEENNGDAE